MALNFETTHEYYVADADLYYCVEHETLIVTRDHQDRLLINGIDHETMLKLARKLIQEDLDKTLAKYENEKVADPEKVDA
jgi:bifunctional N-acetylglucosamine-1-phosphate-uridyltransferase/glucosamine-1-phosphate-acetyltransferase GlmU-like protein